LLSRGDFRHCQQNLQTRLYEDFFLLMYFSTNNTHFSMLYLIMVQHNHNEYSWLIHHKNRCGESNGSELCTFCQSGCVMVGSVYISADVTACWLLNGCLTKMP
jgi:hypothetical protein